MRSGLTNRSLPPLLVLAAVAQPAYACIDIATFEIRDIRQADLVVIGEPVEFTRVSSERPDSLDDYGLLTVRVEKVLKGKASGEIQFYWWNSTFGVPKTLTAPERVLIGAVQAGGKGLPLRGPSATVFPSRRPDLPQILQAPCSSPFILPATPEDETDIRAILRGETVAPHPFAGKPVELRQVPGKRTTWAQGPMAIGALVAALLMACLLSILGKRRRRTL